MPNNNTENVFRNVWVHIEDAECMACNVPKHIYANSLLAQAAKCLSCMDSTFSYMVRHNEGNMETLLEIQNARDNTPEHIDEPDEVCYSCSGIFVEGANQLYDKVAALDASNNMRISHRRCSQICSECAGPFSTWRNNRDHTYMVFFDIYGRSCCRPCKDKLMEENGGSSEHGSCDRCSSIEQIDNTRTFDGITYCTECYNDNVYTCDECDTTYDTNDGHDCVDVVDDESNESHHIHDYNYKPRPYFFGDGAYHLGLELEVEMSRRVTHSKHEGAESIVSDLGDRIYLKQDGSLDNGFEIVTHPHTLSEFHTEFDWEALTKLRKLGFRSWDTRTCGIHVHVSRTAFGQITERRDIVKVQGHELRFMKLIYDNERQITRLAGRSSSYATFQEKGMLVNKLKHGNHHGRYAAINSDNDSTLEIRVFKGSLKPERVLSALELVAASVEYTRGLHVTGKNGALSWLKFTGYVSQNMETYPNLADSMNRVFASDQDPTSDEEN